jgi:hypothetical protein
MLLYVLESWPQVLRQLDSPAAQLGEPRIALELWCDLD